MTAEDLTDWLETTIDYSFDLGWTSRDAATMIVSRMQAEGLVMAPAHPAADLVEADTPLVGAWMLLENKVLAATGALADLEWRPDRSHIEGMQRTMQQAIEEIAEARAALSRYAKGGA